MKIRVTGRQFPLPEWLKERVEEKADLLQSHFDLIDHIEAIFGRVGEQAYSAELIVTGQKGTLLVSKAKAENVQAALDDVVHKMERRLEKRKSIARGRTRRRQMRRHKASTRERGA